MEDKTFLAHALDLKNRCADNSMITSTAFLDERQQNSLSAVSRHRKQEVNTFFFGGYKDAQRQCAVFIPSFFEIDDPAEYFFENEDDSPVVLLHLTKDRFSPTLSHRDYLGALMALGIKKEFVGDILPNDDGADVFVLPSVEVFLCENLKQAGRATIKTERVSLAMAADRKENFEEITAFVSSLRLDNFVAAAFSLSRNKAVQKIEKGLVYINGEQCFKIDAKLNVGDKVVLRGSGKTIFFSQNGESKKGRMHITIKKYI